MNLGQRIQYHREKLKINQKQFAELIGYKNHVSVSRIENGLFYPKLKVLFKISEVLNVPLDDLTKSHLTKYGVDEFENLEEVNELLYILENSDLKEIKFFLNLLDKYLELKPLDDKEE